MPCGALEYCLIGAGGSVYGEGELGATAWIVLSALPSVVGVGGR
jgi:hypothetical protein